MNDAQFLRTMADQMEWLCSGRLNAEAEAELKRLRDIAARIDPEDAWVDTRIVRFENTIQFSHGGFDFDAWEGLRWEIHSPHGSFAVWPSSTVAGRKRWSLYGGPMGLLALDSYSSEKEAKDDAEQIIVSMAAAAALVK